MAKVVKVILPNWLVRWIGDLTDSEETTLSEFLRRSAADRCELRDLERSQRTPRPLLLATRNARRACPRGKLRQISEALDRATETVGEIRAPEPIRGQLIRALEDLEILSDLVYNQDLFFPTLPANDNEP